MFKLPTSLVLMHPHVSVVMQAVEPKWSLYYFPERISNFVSILKSFHFCFGRFGKRSGLEVMAEVLDRVHIILQTCP